MNLQRYTSDQFNSIYNLHIANGSPAPDEVPDLGYVILDNVRFMIAAGFLRMMEGGYAQIDTLVTNPVFSSEDRNQALNLIINKLIDDAKKLGLKGIISWTDHDSIVTRAEELGFNIKKSHILSLRL